MGPGRLVNGSPPAEVSDETQAPVERPGRRGFLTERRVVAGLIAAGLLLGGLGVAALSLSLGLAVEQARIPGQVLLLVGAVIGLAGLGVYVFGPVWRGPRTAATDFGSHRVILTTTLFAVLLAGLVGTVLPIAVLRLTGQRSLQNVPGFLAAAVSVSAVLLGVAYFRFIRPGVVPLERFGFTQNRFAARFFNQVWLTHLLTGLFGWVVILVLSAAIQVVLRSAGVEQTQLREYQWVRELAVVQFLLIVFAGAVLAPFAEEVFFRGIVFRSYLETHGPAVAYLASALVFALLHLNLPALPPILVLGLVLAWLYRFTGSLVPSIIAHGLNNGVAFFVLYFGPEGLAGG